MKDNGSREPGVRIRGVAQMLGCYAVPDISKMKGPAKIKEIVNICKNAAGPNPVRPHPSEVEYTAIERNMVVETDKE